MIARAFQLCKELFIEEDGQDLIEYAIVAGLIGMGAVLSLSNLDAKLKTAFNTIGDRLANAT